MSYAGEVTVKADARARILDAAERLFAERGVENVSLREIGAAAGQRNNSAVQYHFGTRDDLVRALYETRLRPLNDRRRGLLDGLPDRRDLGALVEVYVRPLAEAVARGGGEGSYARFILRFTLDANIVALDGELTDALRETIDLIAEALPHLSPEARAERLRFMQLTVVAALADAESRLAQGGASEPLDLMDHLIAVTVGLLGV